MAWEIREIRWLVKRKKHSYPILFCAKCTCPSKPNSDFSSLRSSDHSSCGALTLPSIHPHLALGSLSYDPRCNLSFHVTMCLISLTRGSLNKGVHQNYLGRCFRSADVRAAFTPVDFIRKTKGDAQATVFWKNFPGDSGECPPLFYSSLYHALGILAPIILWVLWGQGQRLTLLSSFHTVYLITLSLVKWVCNQDAWTVWMTDWWSIERVKNGPCVAHN